MSPATGRPSVHVPRLYHVCELSLLVRLMISFSSQVVSSVSMAPGGSRASWPCLDPWGIIR